jgi:hypothetical protein
MGTLRVSTSVDQMRNVQSRARFEVAEFATRCGEKKVEGSTAQTVLKRIVRLGAGRATSGWLELSSLTRGADGSALFFSPSAQQTLFRQLRSLQASPTGGLETGHAN